MERGICKLCGEEKDLVEAHIFPDFIYKELGEERVRIKMRTPKYPKQKLLEESEDKKGFFDKNILCKNCDGVIINRPETYSNNNFFSKKPCHINNWFEYHLDDYKKLKLFFLSILYRCAISTQFKKEFQTIQRNLTSSEIEILKDSILGKNEDLDFLTCIILQVDSSVPIKDRGWVTAVSTGKSFLIMLPRHVVFLYKNYNDVPSHWTHFVLNSNRVKCGILNQSKFDRFQNSVVGVMKQAVENSMKK